MFPLKRLIRLFSVQMQSIDSIETYVHRISKDLASEKEKIKCNNIIKRYKGKHRRT